MVLRWGLKYRFTQNQGGWGSPGIMATMGVLPWFFRLSIEKGDHHDPSSYLGLETIQFTVPGTGYEFRERRT